MTLSGNVLPMRDSDVHRVIVIAYDDLCTFEFGLAVEVFGLPRPEIDGAPHYDFAIAAAEPGPLRASGGFGVTVDAGLELLDDADTIVVPGWRKSGPEPSAELLDRLRRAHDRGTRIVSICTGAFVVAAAGLLDGRRATTHWMHADDFRTRFPAVEVDPDVLFVDENHIVTSAGSAAGLDAMLHLVRLDHGAEVANAFARRLVVAPQRHGGQAQFIPRPVAARSNDGLAPVLDWAMANLAEPLRVDTLAAQALMTPRTFARRFRDQTGMTPHRWLVAQRVAAACDQLEHGDAPVAAIAGAVGFGSAETLRHHFRQQLGISPNAYRRRFRTQAPTEGT